MSTTINVTVGGNGLLDQSRQQMQANRFGNQERQLDRQIQQSATEQVLQLLTSPNSALPISRRFPEPAANRRNNKPWEGILYSFTEWRGYLGDGSDGSTDGDLQRTFVSWNWLKKYTTTNAPGFTTSQLYNPGGPSTMTDWGTSFTDLVYFEDAPNSPLTTVRGNKANPYTKIRHTWGVGKWCGGPYGNTANSDTTNGSLMLHVVGSEPAFLRIKLSGLGPPHSNQVNFVANGVISGMPTNANYGWLPFTQYIISGSSTDGPGKVPPSQVDPYCYSSSEPWTFFEPSETIQNATSYVQWQANPAGTSAIATFYFSSGNGELEFQLSNNAAYSLNAPWIEFETSWAKTEEGLTDFTI